MTVQTKNFTRFLGNFFIVASVSLLLFIYYPILQLYLFPTTPQREHIKQAYTIFIPKISAAASIIPQVDPWKESVYQKALEKGVAHAAGTSQPGESGTIFLFAHSSASPWSITRTNVAFLRLPEVTRGDTIYIFKDKKEYRYIVAKTKIVWPTEVGYLKPNKKNQLILQTCYPIGTSFQRLLVFATPSP